MRKQERIVNFSALAVVAYTSVIIAIAEESALPYAFTIPIAVAAIVVARNRPTWQLKTVSANILGLLAFALAGTELLMGSIEARLLSGAHLMAYLTWIVLWQKKQLTQYWWLFALSVIQVAIGAILMGTALYGLFLFGFLLLSIWTLAIFSIYRSQLRFASPKAEGWPGLERSETPANDGTGVSFRSGPGHPSPAPRVSQASGTVQVDTDRWVTSRFVGGLLGISFASAVVGFVFFLLVPRNWIGEVAWGMDPSRGNSLTGFGDSVRLGSFGTLLESRERVMEVRLFDERDRPLDVEAHSAALGFDSPLFRGSVLDQYENGQWSNSRGRGRGRGRTVSLNRSRPPHSIRQEYHLKPVRSRILFVMQQSPLRGLRGAVVDAEDPVVVANPIDGVIRHNNRRTSLRIVEYEVYSAPASRSTPVGAHYIDVIYQTYQTISDARLKAGLREFAESEIGVAASDPPRERARKIVAFLRDSGKFTYTLKIPRRQHPELDPVLEFLRYRRTGHCEYFATALGLLLRAVQVPSRLVWGFKGGQQNELSGYFEVEQRHAHVWIEARIDGQWATLDATPAARADAIEPGEGLGQSWINLKNYFTSLWSQFVIGISLADQSRTIYSPLEATARDAWNSVSRERKKSASGLQALLDFLSNPSRWFSWQGGLLVFVLMLMLASLYWSARKVVGLLRNLSRELAAAQRQRMHVAFYERFCRLCESHGLRRGPAQTQREFAADVAGRFSTLLQPAGCAAVPRELAAAFYDVRFGARDLDDDELRDIDRMLTEFKQRLPRGNGSPGGG
jgi:protein-glutamine gamma-glutamyltransferase